MESRGKIPTLVGSCGRHFLSLIGSLAGTSRYTEQVKAVAITEEFDRFKVWAGNIAAHRTGRRSLEYRLRDAPLLKEETCGLLSSLEGSLLEAIAIVTEERVPWDESAQSDSESESDAEDPHSSGDTELQLLAGSIKNSITCLFKLTIAIRDPAPESQLRSAITFDKSHFHPHDISHVKEKFPSGREYLVERLGIAISGRRSYLAYRERHSEKLSNHVDAIGEEDRHTMNTANSTEATPVPSSVADPEAIHVNEDADELQSQTSYATTAPGASIRVPRLPKVAEEEEFYECPLCFMIVSIHTQHAWKQHVFKDLHPYCCTEEQCATADRLYDSRHAWFKHELQAHRAFWQCVDGCNRTFTSEKEFEVHAVQAHPDVASPEILPILKQTAIKSADMQTKTKCPLCDKALSLQKLQKHLGNHQEQLALFALPSNTDGISDDDDYESQSTRSEMDESELADLKETDVNLNDNNNAMLPPSQSNPIFVTNLDPEVTPTELLSLFQNRYSSCEEVKIVMNPPAGPFRCIGTVHFSDSEQQKQAILQMNGVYCGSRPMHLSSSLSERPKADRGNLTDESDVDSEYQDSLPLDEQLGSIEHNEPTTAAQTAIPGSNIEAGSDEVVNNKEDAPRAPLGQQPNGMPGQQLLMEQQQGALSQRQRLVAARNLLQQSPSIIQQTDSIPFPPVTLNAHLRSMLPPDVTTWAQLKQWVSHNQALVPSLDANKLIMLQTLHFQEGIRHQQGLMAGAPRPLMNTPGAMAVPQAQMTPGPQGNQTPQQLRLKVALDRGQFSPEEKKIIDDKDADELLVNSDEENLDLQPIGEPAKQAAQVEKASADTEAANASVLGYSKDQPPQASQQAVSHLIQPEDVMKLDSLSAESKIATMAVMEDIWKTYNDSSAGSYGRSSAEQAMSALSETLIRDERAYRLEKSKLRNREFATPGDDNENARQDPKGKYVASDRLTELATQKQSFQGSKENNGQNLAEQQNIALKNHDLSRGVDIVGVQGSIMPQEGFAAQDNLFPSNDQSQMETSTDPSTDPSQPKGNHTLQDYQMELMLFEQQNKERLLKARQTLFDNDTEDNVRTENDLPSGSHTPEDQAEGTIDHPNRQASTQPDDAGFWPPMSPYSSALHDVQSIGNPEKPHPEEEIPAEELKWVPPPSNWKVNDSVFLRLKDGKTAGPFYIVLCHPPQFRTDKWRYDIKDSAGKTRSRISGSIMF